jgi:hypothetical protein
MFHGAAVQNSRTTAVAIDQTVPGSRATSVEVGAEGRQKSARTSAPPSFQCAGNGAETDAASGCERPLESHIFNRLDVTRGQQGLPIRTHNAEVVSSSLTLATNYTRVVPEHIDDRFNEPGCLILSWPAPNY